MTMYKVAILTTATAVIDVEADSPEEAKELVWEQGLPYAGAFDDYEFGDWYFASDAGLGKPEADAWEATE